MSSHLPFQPPTEEELEALRTEYIKPCVECGGIGSRVSRKEGGVEFITCSCAHRCNEELKWVLAGIPPRLRKWKMGQLSAEFIQNNTYAVSEIQTYQRAIKLNCKEGNGLFLCSGNGLAKSSIAAALLKEAIGIGLQGAYLSAPDLVNLLFQRISSNNSDAAEIYSELTNGRARIIVVDEIDKIYTKGNDSFGFNSVSAFFNSLYNNLVALVVCSNISIVQLQAKKSLDDSVIDRLRELKPLTFLGQSHRITKPTDDEVL